MDVTGLTDVLEPLGPTTTVTVDVTANDEDGAHERHLKWESLRKDLQREGAQAEDLAALDAVVEQSTGIAGEASRFLAARGGKVLFDELLVEDTLNGVGSSTTGPIVDVVPLLRYEARHAPVVVVRANLEGADVEVLSAVGGQVEDSASTHGSTFRIHKVGIGGWRTPQYQRTTANTWHANAGEAAGEVDRLVLDNAAVAVILSGDQRARQLVLDQLHVRVPVVQVEGDTRAAGSEQAQIKVDVALARGLDERAARTEDEAVHRWQAVHDDPLTRTRSTKDLGETALAIRQGQVEELLIVPAALRTRKLLVGPTGPDVALPGTPVPWDGPVSEAPADLALLRAAAATGAQVQLVELESAVIPDGAAARLRWSTDETPGTEGGQQAPGGQPTGV